jgi:hypothetical protein
MNSSRRALVATILSAAVSFLLAGCASSIPRNVKLDDIPADQVARIDALPEAAPGGYTKLGDVEGISCNHRSPKTSASWEDAVRRTKFRALKMGADAIADLDCGLPKEGPLLSRLTGYVLSTCEETIRCTASAVRK